MSGLNVMAFSAFAVFLLPDRIKFRFLEAKAIIHTETAITGPERIVLFLSKHNKIIVKLLT